MTTLRENLTQVRLDTLREEWRLSFEQSVGLSVCIARTKVIQSTRRACNGLKRRYEALLQQGPTNDPLVSLPPDIWIPCLMEATSGQVGGLLPLMTVSRLWMREILGNSSLWAKIYIDASENSEQVLACSCILSAGLPLELVIYWPLSDSNRLWSKLQLATPRCTRLLIDIGDGFDAHRAGREMFMPLFTAFSWPILAHLEISTRFDAKAWDRLYVVASTSLRSIRGVSKGIHQANIGWKYPSPHKDFSWKGDQVTVSRLNCTVRDFTIVPRESLQSYDIDALRHLDLHPPDRKGGAGQHRPFPSLTYLPTYMHAKSLRLHENTPSWWFYIRYHGLREIVLAINASQVADAIKLLSSSPRVSFLKFTVVTDEENPQDASSIPQLSELATLHLEIGRRGAHSQGDLVNTTPENSKWLVGLLKRFLRTCPPVHSLTFRAMGVPIDIPTSAEFIVALSSLKYLQQLTLPTVLSYHTSETGKIRLPSLKYLVTKDENILSYLDTPHSLVVETISVRGQQRVVDFPSNCGNSSSVHTLRYGMNCLPGETSGGIFESLQIVEFMKQDMRHEETWPSAKVDKFCEILLDHSICPQLHTIGSSLFTSWDGILRLIVARNFIDDHRVSANIKCIRVSRLPHPRFLIPLATLLRGMFPPYANGDTHTIRAYRDENVLGCFNCLASGWGCYSPPELLRVEEDPIAAEMPYLECHGPLHELIFGSQDLWETHRARITMCRAAALQQVKRVPTCSRYHNAGKWLPLVDITPETLGEEHAIMLQESEGLIGDFETPSNRTFSALLLLLVLLSQWILMYKLVYESVVPVLFE